MRTLFSFAVLVAIAATANGQAGAGVGSNGNVANAGTNGQGNVGQVGGCSTANTGLVLLCVAGICSCVLPGAGVGDPILQDFAGNRFEFFGEPESHYNLYSDLGHQVNMRLFKGFVDGHEGTYMDAFGIAYRDLRVNITLISDGDISAETWQEGTSVQPHKQSLLASGVPSLRAMSTRGGSMNVETEPFRPWAGRTVEVTTGGLKVSVWAVPSGTLDSQNVSQPAYLNFNMSLLQAPQGDAAEGIIGESVLEAVLKNTIDIFSDSLPSLKPGEFRPFSGKGLMNDYRVDGLFGTDFAFNRFGGSQVVVSRRALKDDASRLASLKFPLRSSSA